MPQAARTPAATLTLVRPDERAEAAPAPQADPVAERIQFTVGEEALTPKQRLKQIQKEARDLALGMSADFLKDLQALQVKAEELSGLGDPTPVGVLELARTMSAELGERANTLGAILNKVPK